MFRFSCLPLLAFLTERTGWVYANLTRCFWNQKMLQRFFVSWHSTGQSQCKILSSCLAVKSASALCCDLMREHGGGGPRAWSLPVGVDSAPRQLLWLVGGCYCYCAHTGRERERERAHANTGSGAASAWVPAHRRDRLTHGRRGAESPSHSPTRLCNSCPSLAGLLLVAVRRCELAWPHALPQHSATSECFFGRRTS